MKRTLVLTHEEARHPFRRNLPRHIFVGSNQPAEPVRVTRNDDQDWKLFLLSFTAFFIAIYSFIG